MSDTSQASPAAVQNPIHQAAFAADQPGSELLHNAQSTFGPGVEAPRAIQEQQAARLAAEQAAALQQHPQVQARYTEEDLNKARTEANDQVYTQMNEMRTQLQQLQAERQAEQDRIKQEQEAAAEAQRLAEEEKMGAKALAERVREEMNSKFAEVEQRAAAAEAIIAKEREYSELVEYRNQRLQSEDVQQAVPPQLLHLIKGNTKEEIEQSIQEFTQAAGAMLQEIQSAQQIARQQAPGVSTRAPGALSGPMDLTQQQQPVTKEWLDSLTPAEYARHRNQLLSINPYKA